MTTTVMTRAAAEVSSGRERLGIVGRHANDRMSIRGIGFDRVTEAAAVQHVCDALDAGRGGWVVTPNVDIASLCRSPDLRTLVNSAHLVVCDGTPLLWASWLMGDALPERVTGSSLIWTLTRAAAAQRRKVFLLGAAPGVGEKAAARLNAAVGEASVVGSYSPSMGFEEVSGEQQLLFDALSRANPDIVFCAFGFPKQERLIQNLRKQFPAVWFVGCGAAIDMAAGESKRAPASVQSLGLEWLYRLGQEPQRLWRRYLVRDLPYAVGLLAYAGAVGAQVRLAGVIGLRLEPPLK